MFLMNLKIVPIILLIFLLLVSSVNANIQKDSREDLILPSGFDEILFYEYTNDFDDNQGVVIEVKTMSEFNDEYFDDDYDDNLFAYEQEDNPDKTFNFTYDPSYDYYSGIGEYINYANNYYIVLIYDEGSSYSDSDLIGILNNFNDLNNVSPISI